MTSRLTLKQAGGFRQWIQQPDILWEAGLVAGGVALVALTFNLYPRFDIHGATNRAHPLSSSQASRQIEAAKDYLTTHPDDINTYVALAMAYYQKGPDSYVEGLNALEKARALGATSERLFYYAGVMYQHLGLSDYAMNEYTKYLRHHPHDYETMIRLANVHFQQKHLDQAEALYKEALDAWPKDATSWFNYAIVNKEKGKYDEALEALAKAEKVAGQLPPGGLYQEGEIYRLKGDSEKAMQLFQQELAAQPEFIPALEGTEALLKAKGDTKGAREVRKRMAEIKKKQTPAPAAS